MIYDTTMQKTVSSLLDHIAHISCHGSQDTVIDRVTLDSRQIVQNTLFIAQRGETVDGHSYIPQAVDQGATVVVCEYLPDSLEDHIAYIIVSDSHAAAGNIAAWFYDFPTNDLTVVGITGTNGKTTVATLLWQSLRLLGKKTGLVSTVSYWIDDTEFPSTHTTPDAVSLQKLFRDMRDAGCTHVVMEVSSHAVVQKRIAGISFHVGIFTNLTQDHLDFHKTMENYSNAKRSFFSSLSVDAIVITNSDDSYGEIMISDSQAKQVRYSIEHDADYVARDIALGTGGTTFTINGEPVHSQLIGTFNLSNSLAVYAALCELGYDQKNIIDLFPKLLPPPGRFEIIRGPGDRVGIVDYAHTPDGLEKLLTTLHDLKRSDTSLIAVFGCGGNRDTGKRPQMGAIAVRYADHVIITSDNPRNENPEVICRDIEQGIVGPTNYEVIVDRADAIARAIAISKPGDTIAVAGKGHEQYQITGEQKLHFSDQEVLQEYFEKIKTP